MASLKAEATTATQDSKVNNAKEAQRIINGQTGGDNQINFSLFIHFFLFLWHLHWIYLHWPLIYIPNLKSYSTLTWSNCETDPNRDWPRDPLNDNWASLTSVDDLSVIYKGAECVLRYVMDGLAQARSNYLFISVNARLTNVRTLWQQWPMFQRRLGCPHLLRWWGIANGALFVFEHARVAPLMATLGIDEFPLLSLVKGQLATGTIHAANVHRIVSQ